MKIYTARAMQVDVSLCVIQTGQLFNLDLVICTLVWASYHLANFSFHLIFPWVVRIFFIFLCHYCLIPSQSELSLYGIHYHYYLVISLDFLKSFIQHVSSCKISSLAVEEYGGFKFLALILADCLKYLHRRNAFDITSYWCKSRWNN